jgi:hypothetical protein
LFPAPPTHSSQLKQVLRRVTNIKVQDKVAHQIDTFDLPMTRGLDNTEIARVKSLCEVDAVVDEPEWIPKEKDRGVWKRSVRLALELQFPLPPAHSTDILDWRVRFLDFTCVRKKKNSTDCKYELGFVIPFPGTGNDLKISSPIQLCASSSRESTSPPPQIHFSPYASLLSEWISAEDQAVRIFRVETTTGATTLMARLVLWAMRLATP